VKLAGLLHFGAALAIGGPALAQMSSMGGGDPHIQIVPFDPQKVITLRVAQGFVLTLELAPDERIESVAVGNAAAWQVTPNRDADHLFIKALPNAVVTNLTVVTGSRSYSFELQPLYAPDPTMAYIVRLTSLAPAQPPALAVAADHPVVTRYHFDGAHRLRPASMRDDGRSTYISYGPRTTVGAVYVVDDEGREALVNGGFRKGEYVVDQIADHFIFRLGKSEATATRHIVKTRRK
jgi:type IV secretion system protein VirB9